MYASPGMYTNVEMYNPAGRDGPIRPNSMYPTGQNRLLTRSVESGWGPIAGHRAFNFGPGEKAIGVYSDATGTVNGVGMSMLRFAADPAHWQNQHFGCLPSANWEESGWESHNIGGPREMCRVTINLPYRSVVMAEFTGHMQSTATHSIIHCTLSHVTLSPVMLLAPCAAMP